MHPDGMSKAVSIGVSLLTHLLFAILLLSYIELSHKSGLYLGTHDRIALSSPRKALLPKQRTLLLETTQTAPPTPEQPTDMQHPDRSTNQPDPLANRLTAALQQLIHSDTDPVSHSPEPNATQPEALPDFSRIARGFLSVERPSLISESRMPPMAASADIKFERFAQKLLAAVYNSFKILQRTASLPFAPYGKTYICIDLNPDGTLAQSRVSQASSNPYFDHFLLRVVQDAGSIFPPPPAGLQQQLQQLTIIVSVTYENGMIPRIRFSLL